ncbi:biotin--[acetyl-CoA-carboxylase] ligase [Bordetella pertussis]
MGAITIAPMSAEVRSLSLPEPAALARAIAARLPAFRDISWVGSTGSTNADLLARARAGGGARPCLLGAHLQETGRGRAGRPWQNRVGAALMFSCAFDVDLPPSQLPALSPLAGMAACEALRQLVGQPAGLLVKWPNDVQWHDAKLAGVLVESARNPAGTGHAVVIGMGLNLHGGDALSQALQRSVADWNDVAGPGEKGPDAAADLVAAVARAWQDAAHTLQQEGFGAFGARFARVDALAGRPVNVIDRGEILYTGAASGVDDHGRLLVQAADGMRPVSVGEISIRPQA